MRYWFTTHFPHYVADEADWSLYVRRGDEDLVKDFQAGDQVVFYEVAKGPDRIGKGKRPAGVKGVRCLAIAAGPAQPAVFQENYDDGRRAFFSLECPCTEHDFGHVLSMDDLFGVLGRRLNLRGLGGGAGFIQISEAEFSRIHRAFTASAVA